MSEAKHCPDCDGAGEYAPAHDGVSSSGFSRRTFIASAGALAAVAGSMPLGALADAPAASATKAAAAKVAAAETTVKVLYDSLSEAQRKQICFDWDYHDPKRGLLRSFVANNWNITKPQINSQFFTGQQRSLIRTAFEDIIQPDWHARIDKQLKDDAGGFGQHQSIAIFGKPGDGKFEFVMTGRHMTLRCDGNSSAHTAFGGPIFYGHAASGFDEPSDHPGNVFWPQAQLANDLYKMLDGKQRKLALKKQSPREQAVAFRGGKGEFPGVPVGELSADQRLQLEKVLAKLVEPYRQADRDNVARCLKAQGGVEKCALAFYSDEDVGGDGVWDNWRLEGPAFVWYFRGSPHVHVWVNIADDPSVKTNS